MPFVSCSSQFMTLPFQFAFIICIPAPISIQFLQTVTAQHRLTCPQAKTKPTYTRRSSTGGYATLLLLFLSFLLSLTELRRWYRGHETHLFSVEKGVSHDLQINLDIVVPMACGDLHINVQDASGDRILAGDMLTRDPTNWMQWVDMQGNLHAFENLGEMEVELEKDTHVGHVLGEVRRQKKKFRKTPRLRKGGPSACRVYGSLEGNKVQGDFHITARGHGYFEFAEHLDHSGKFLSDDLYFFSAPNHSPDIVAPKSKQRILISTFSWQLPFHHPPETPLSHPINIPS